MVEQSETAKEKYKAINRLLDGEYVLLHLNTASEGLSIPAYLCAESVVTLKVSRWFRGSMSVNETGIEAELLFNNNYFKCIIPFSSVWGITGSKGENLIWPGSVPPGLLNKTAEEGKEVDEKTSRLEAVKKDEPQSQAESEKSCEDKKKPHLVRVK